MWLRDLAFRGAEHFPGIAQMKASCRKVIQKRNTKFCSFTKSCKTTAELLPFIVVYGNAPQRVGDPTTVAELQTHASWACLCAKGSEELEI